MATERDMDGMVVKVGEPLGESVGVQVQTDEGAFTGYWWNLRSGWFPKVGYRATIRIYGCGGGWYPDNIIVSWSSR